MTSRRNPASILVIDDDPMSREMLAVLLEGEGHRVATAESGNAALALLEDPAKIPEVVLTDMKMPGIAGASLAARLRQACGPGTLLLAMSGSAAPEDAVCRFDGFLNKPFRPQQVAEAIAAQTAPQRAEPTAAVSEIALNETIYAQLALAMPATQLHRMFVMCLSDARERVADMRTAAATNDNDAFLRQAHAIKGGCGMLGATAMYMRAAALETSGLDAMKQPGETMKDVNPLDELLAAADELERILDARALSATKVVDATE